MKTSIECNNVSIKYITGDLKAIGLKEYVVRHLVGKYHVEEFWADKNITFKINEGDMLGIIGTNGAGKSTLLKAVTGIMKPGEGSIHTKGRIAALLELTSGFDGDMTVRENTFLRGAMLGYTKDFMVKKYDEIIAFAELEEFQEYTFNQLSSGMKSRLAFSIACLVNPDILILDEVLSVGDGAFRVKSGEKMKQILETGVTGILVSHAVSQIRELCNKVLWIDHGNQIAFSDDVEKICNAYEAFLMDNPLPTNDEEMTALASIFEKKMEEEKLERIRRRTKKLENLLEKGSNISPVSAAINVVAKHNPELLNAEAVRSSQFAASVELSMLENLEQLETESQESGMEVPNDTGT
ncbi:MAG: ABC transporter ATP-binding protein [Clostridiales bacterium]|nr:ABC transporter ATP-binding protein [Clostridiales bacterium]